MNLLRSQENPKQDKNYAQHFLYSKPKEAGIKEFKIEAIRLRNYKLVQKVINKSNKNFANQNCKFSNNSHIFIAIIYNWDLKKKKKREIGWKKIGEIGHEDKFLV